MGDFFTSWRRKVGLLALCMALLFIGGWIRSLSIVDVFVFPMGTHTAFALSTAGNSINWRVGFDEDQDEEFDWYILDYDEYEYTAPGESGNDHRYQYPIDNNHERVDWTWRWLGFGIGVTPSEFWDGFRQTYLIIPFWMLVIPSTLVSSWLLLSSRRLATQKKFIEPLPENIV